MDVLPGDHESAAPGRARRVRRATMRVAAGLGIATLIATAAAVSTLPLGPAQTDSASHGVGFYPIGSAVEGLGIGQSAPDFVAGDGRTTLLTDVDGRPIRLADFAGRPLWIVFWATWCTPCQQEAKDIRAAFHAHRKDQLAVLAIDIQEPAAAVRAYALAHDLDYTIGLDPTAAVMALYRARGLPSHFFLDADGLIRERYAGQMTAELMEQHLVAITRD